MRGHMCKNEAIIEWYHILILFILPLSPLFSTGSHITHRNIEPYWIHHKRSRNQICTNSETYFSVNWSRPPLVPHWLVTKIESGEFIDMSQLLPDQLGCTRGQVLDDQSGVLKSKRHLVSNILGWIQCFGVYMAVITCKQPKRIQNLLGCSH